MRRSPRTSARLLAAVGVVVLVAACNDDSEFTAPRVAPFTPTELPRVIVAVGDTVDLRSQLGAVMLENEPWCTSDAYEVAEAIEGTTLLVARAAGDLHVTCTDRRSLSATPEDPADPSGRAVLPVRVVNGLMETPEPF